MKLAKLRKIAHTLIFKGTNVKWQRVYMAYLVKTAIDYIENLEDGNFYPLQDTAYTALDVSVATVFAS